MATIVEELIGLVGLEIDEGSFRRGANALENIGRQYERVAQSARNLALAGAGVLAFTAITNKMTAEQERMAEAVGVSSNTLKAFAGVAREGGLDLDTVVDLVEEMNNKLGESKGIEEMLAVTEATAILGLEFENLRKLKPEEQFIRILEAAKDLEDQQEAAAALDILVGSNANKFVGLLRTQDKSIRQIIDGYERLNFLTEEGAKEATKFNKTFLSTTKIFTTATQQLAALLGRAIEPMLKAFNNWIADNKQLSQSIIALFANVIPWAFGVAGLAVAALTLKLIAMAVAWTAVSAKLIALIALGIIAAAAIALITEDIIGYVKHGDEAVTTTGRLATWLKNLALAARVNVGMAFDFVNEKIQSVVDKFNEFIDLIKNSKVVKFFDFGDDDEETEAQSISAVQSGAILTAVPTVSQSQAGAVGPLRSAGNTTTNSNQTSNTFNVIANNLTDIQRMLEEAAAQAARANSTGVLR